MYDNVIDQFSKVLDSMLHSDIPEKTAQFYATLRRELINEGFTREESFQILIHQVIFKLNQN